MQESAVVRLLGDQLAWYPPGSSAQPRSLAEEDERAQLESIATARRAPLVFAAPAPDVVLKTVEFAASEKRHIVKSLPYLLEDEFATDIESLHFASRSLSRLSLGVAVCAHERMAEWEERLSGLPPLPQWIPEPLLLPWQEGELCVLFEDDGVLVRSGANDGFGVDRELANGALESLAAERDFQAVVVYSADRETDEPLLPATLRDGVQWRSGGFAEALMLSREDQQPLNLRQGSYGARLPLRRWWSQWRIAAGLFAAAFGLQVASTWASYEQLADTHLELRRQVEAAYREVVPRGAVVDPERQLNQKLQALRGDGTAGVSFVAMMARIGRVVDEQRSAQVTNVNFNDRLAEVRLNIVVPDFRAVEAIRARMSELGLEATMENSNVQGQMVRARLKVKAQ